MATRQSWLGHQETLYSGLQWHLNVPSGYVAQTSNLTDADLFPGRARLNGASGTGPMAIIVSQGAVWTSDIMRCTGRRPKLYGFDFARVTEVTAATGGRSKKLLCEMTPSARATSTGFASERNMMFDLILSTWKSEGEVCFSYHMLNPFLPQTGIVSGAEIFRTLSIKPSDSHQLNAASSGNLGSTPATDMKDFDLDKVDLANATDHHSSPSTARTARIANARAIFIQGFKQLGQFIQQLFTAAGAQLGSRKIYIRPLHEPNIHFFWWGQTAVGASGRSARFITHFRALYKLAVDTIRAEIQASLRSHVEFVFCINGADSPLALEEDLLAYLFTGSPASFSGATPDPDMLSRVDIVGLDFYRDNQTLRPLKPKASLVSSSSQLVMQYEKVKACAAAMSTTSRIVDHTLSEVGLRTNHAGRLYGCYGRYAAWPSKHRQFFGGAVAYLTVTHEPKWVLFWANRIGNTILDDITPTVSGPTGLAYDRTDPFSSPSAEFFTPAHPYKTTGRWPKRWGFPVKLRRGNAKAYQRACRDFYDMIQPSSSGGTSPFATL